MISVVTSWNDWTTLGEFMIAYETHDARPVWPGAASRTASLPNARLDSGLRFRGVRHQVGDRNVDELLDRREDIAAFHRDWPFLSM